MFRDSRRVRQLLGLMILTSITLITIDYRSGVNSPFRGLRRTAGTFFGPIERGVSAAVRPIGNALSTLGNVGNLDKEVKKLRAERAAVEGQKRTNDDKQRQFDDMKKLLTLTNEGQYRTIPAHVVAAAPANFTWTVTIDAGRDRGVRSDMTVINAAGLVGRVLEVSKFTSIVLLAIDRKFGVGARVSYTGERGSLKGNGPDEMQFEVTPATTVVTAGQPIVTAGSTFVPGVPIGKVVATRAAPGDTFRTVVVKPYVNFSNLDLVAVVVKPERKIDPDALVPANPRPSASSPALPKCGAKAPAQVAAGSPSAAASTSASTSAPTSASKSAQPTSAQPTEVWVPCLSSEPPGAGSAGSPSPAPTP